MRGPFRDRSIFFQLLGGTMTILTVATLLWLAADMYFLHVDARADARRWLAALIARETIEARQAEQAFLLDDADSDAFYATGESRALTQQRAVTARLVQDIDSLETLSEPAQRAAEVDLREGVTAYTADVNDLVRTLQRRGRGNHGVEGEWRAAVSALSAQFRGAGAERDAARLVSAQQSYLATPDQAAATAVDAAHAALAVSARAVPGGAALVARSDSLFRVYRDLEDQIGQTASEGLKGKTDSAMAKVVPAADSILGHAEQASERALGRLRIATPLGLLLALACAGLFLYFFATSVSRTTTELGTAAMHIGRGQFNMRVATSGKDELSRLGEEFNRMAENLSALVSSVQKSGIQINTSVMEIAATARQQQTTATEIAATTSEVGATAREISATSQELSKNMNQVAETAERTAELAGSGQTGIGRMASTMQQISDAAEAISARLATLSDKAANIYTVVTTITKVADQTNLLSLNAAIEAEKAGEYGRGFAVVAAEIRRLADQTALATGDIERIVKEIQSAVTAGVMGMDKFSDEVSRGVEASRQVGEQLTGIIQQVQTLTPNFEMVNEGMQSQAESAQQISDALAQLVAFSQQTAESLVQSNKAIEQLNDASRGLQAGVSRFTTAA